MNDFTKEELNMMADGIVLLKIKCNMSDNIFKQLNGLDEKLCSMINNYCEHDTIGGEIDLFIDTCSKCNAFMLRNTHYENQ